MTNIYLSEWIDYNIVCAQDYLIKMIIDYLSISNNIYSTFIEHVTLNKFIGNDNKDLITYYFHKATRNRFIIHKFIRYWRFKRKNLHYINDTDLLLEPFDNTKNYPTIVEDKGIYRFGSGDIHKMFISKLEYSEYQMPRILPIKNPWSNKILNKTQLYNLFISSYQLHKTPWLFIEYAKLDFNDTLLLRRHNSYLSEKAIYNDVSNLSEKEFRKECDRIFRYNIVNSIIRYNHFKYNSLDSIQIHILRKFFKKIIIDNYLKDGFGLSISSKQKQSLFKLWGTYPHIITKVDKNKTNSDYEIDISRARLLYAYNEILNLSQNNTINHTQITAQLPDITDISFEESIEYRRNSIINLANSRNNFNRTIRPLISFQIEGRDTNTNDIPFLFRSTNQQEIPNIFQENLEQYMEEDY